MEPINVLQNIGPTRHFQQRAEERGLTRDLVDFILTWGTAVEARDNAYYFTIVRRELEGEAQWSPMVRRADGWVLVVGERGRIITCFRRAWRLLRRKS